ncbi:MAG: HAD family hydrolase [Proteobacteria bacterium]|nr:HAD family hydrolase [Pseudomonadota bacterium]MDA1063598.1 HAD family hydrolase [Pseudomonadota bacterium]
MKDIRAITIDLDDTLWAIHPVIHRAERRLYEWLGEHYPRITTMNSRDAILQQRVAVAADFPEQNHDYTFMRRTVLGRLGHAANYGDALVDEAMAVFDAARNDVAVFPEVRPALAALRERYVLVAVTNGNADLKRIGIDDLFHHFVSARTAGAAKPAQKIFDAAVQAGGADLQQTVHVGDHPEIDVQGARSAGLHSIWVNRSGQPWPGDLPRPDGIVTHIGQLQGLLDALRR